MTFSGISSRRFTTVVCPAHGGVHTSMPRRTYNPSFTAFDTRSEGRRAALARGFWGSTLRRRPWPTASPRPRHRGSSRCFGTMCKPLHAGMAAQNGLIAARLAAKGFTARPDALECAQGLAATQSADFNPQAAMQEASLDFHIAANLFKYHAACYLTHGAIEAGRALRGKSGASSNAIETISIRVPPVADRVCNIAAPSTGLEAKFSLRLTVAMALSGRDTSGIATYTDELTREPELVRLRDLATIEFVEGLPEAKAEVAITVAGGSRYEAVHDAGLPDTDLQRQGQKLERKFDALVGPIMGARAQVLRDGLTGFGGTSAVNEITRLAGGSA